MVEITTHKFKRSQSFIMWKLWKSVNIYITKNFKKAISQECKWQSLASNRITCKKKKTIYAYYACKKLWQLHNDLIAITLICIQKGCHANQPKITIPRVIIRRSSVFNFVFDSLRVVILLLKPIPTAIFRRPLLSQKLHPRISKVVKSRRCCKYVDRHIVSSLVSVRFQRYNSFK